MHKLIVFGFVAIIASAFAVDCPDETENSTATYFPHETECGKFYECHYGQVSLFDCPPGTYWNSRINVCSRDVECGDLSTSTAAPTKPTEATTVPTESPDETSQE